MEIKKGISQMAEYPNREINYVIPIDGQMYYVLEDGVLANGCIVATLNPKRAIDSSIATNDIGVFAEDGSVLIDFNKKDIRKIDDDYLLVVESIPKSELVVNALKNENDEISKTAMKDNSTTIVDKMIVEMGAEGKILFSDAYSEASVYKTDSVNNKIAEGSSFIGKNNDSFYFHTNDVSSETVIYTVNEKKEESVAENDTMSFADFNVAGKGMEFENSESNVVNSDVNEMWNNMDSSNSESLPEEVNNNMEQDSLVNGEETDDSDVKLNINKSFLDEFKFIDEDRKENNNENTEQNNDAVIEENSFYNKDSEKSTVENDEVLDNAITVMKKMIEETAKLNDRISELEKQLEEKEKVISSDMTKKNTLNDLLDEANEVLEKID